LFLLKHIGFNPIKENEISSLIQKGQKFETSSGYYILYHDPSGAEIFFQFSNEGKLLGTNVHFQGSSSLPVSIIKKIDRDESSLDGAVLAWAAPTDLTNPETGLYPFAFEVPDFYTEKVSKEKFPISTEVQLAAFPEKEIHVFKSEDEFNEVLGLRAKISSRSVIPSGLFTKNAPYEPKAFINGIVKFSDKVKNLHSGLEFIHLVIETAGGTLDIITADSHLTVLPEFGSIVSADFWLSGKVK
jgi:hypothetical protein